MHFSYVRDNTALQLPAARIATELNRALQARGGAVVTAPPGSGKSTLLPLTMLAGMDACTGPGGPGDTGTGRGRAPAAVPAGKILMLEPRRLAARQIALRLARISGTAPGTLTGYRMRFETSEFYIKSEEEMRALFPQWPEAADNTARIAERCNLDFTFGEYHLPEFIPPAGHTCLSLDIDTTDSSAISERAGEDAETAILHNF